MIDDERLLVENDRPRALREDERSRLLERLAAAADAQDLLLPSDLADLPGSMRSTPEPMSRSAGARWERWLLVAAVSLVAVGLLGFAVRVVLTATPESAAVDADPSSDALPVARVCATEIEEVIAALEAWGGVGSWVLVNQEPVPDLAGSISAAFAALVPLDPSLVAPQQRFEAESDRASDTASDRAARELRAREALDELVSSLERLDPDGSWCDLPRFRSAVALDL